jgi:MATE family multidrug resistance protein
MLFVNHFDLGIRGLNLAGSVKDFILLLSVMIYGNCSSEIRPALSTPDSSSFFGWGEYLQISIPSTIMICAEWWAFEVLTVISGNLGVTELAA